MADEKRMFFDYFPLPPELNPFTFKSVEDYTKASEIWDEIGRAMVERDNILNSQKSIQDSDVKRWQELYKKYEVALAQGLQDRFKKE